jgi:glycosyltransferase involved in cell wall biosynthesis
VAVGRLFRQKGFDLLLHALRDLRRNFPEIHLTILGEGPEREALERLARRLGVDSALSLPGHVDNPFGAMRSADLLVCSSRFEGFSNAILEALAVGTPVVAARGRGAADEVIRDGFNGFLASSVDPQALDRAITRAVKSLVLFDRDAIVADCRLRYGIAASARRYADAIRAAARA